MKKNVRILTFSLFLLASYFIVQRDKFEQFYPIIWSVEYDELVIDDINISDKFYTNLEKVLTHYKEDYEIRDGIIYVKKTLYKDKDLCWNYTSKANDKVWLHSK